MDGTVPREPRDLMRQLMTGQLDRRGFIRRAIALGFSASAVAGFLAACGGSPTATAPATTSTSSSSSSSTTAAATSASTSSATSSAASATTSAATSSAAPGGAGSASTTASSTSAAGSASPAASPTTSGGGGVGTKSKGPFGNGGGTGPGPTKRGGGGAVKILFWQAPTILNPYLASGTKDIECSRPVYEPLADFDVNDQMVPWLAADIPSLDNGSVAKDGTSVTWKLKSGIKWSDGQPFTAKDVVFTWKYAVDKDTATVSASTYETVKNVEAPDDTTVKITFNGPTPGWYIPFTGYANGVILPEHIFKDGMGAQAKNFPANLKPVGTGPYVVTDFKPGDSASFKINDNWRDANGPFYDTIEWKGGGDATSAARAVLQTGDFDIAWNLQIEPSILNQLTGAGAKGKLGFQPGFGVERVLFNFTDPNKEVDGERSSIKAPHPFLADKAVRLAICMLGDRKTMAETLYGPAGKPTAAIINAPESVIPADVKDDWVFDVTKGSAALDATGWVKQGQYRAKGGVPMKVVYSTTVNSVRQKEQQILKDALEKAGIQTELKSVDSGVFFSSDAGNPDTAAHFYTDLEMYTNSQDNPDSQSYFNIWLSDQIPSKANSWGLNNTNRYQNPDYDKVVKAAAVEMDPAKRSQLFMQAQEILHKDAVNMPLVARLGPFAFKTGMAGFAESAWPGLVWNIANWTKS
jgi:peptide/nickel transport system substrate-binding protein